MHDVKMRCMTDIATVTRIPRAATLRKQEAILADLRMPRRSGVAQLRRRSRPRAQAQPSQPSRLPERGIVSRP